MEMKDEMDDGEWAMVEAHMEEISMDLMMANIAFLAVALGGTVMFGMDLFAWKFAVVTPTGEDDADVTYSFTYEDMLIVSDDLESANWETGSLIYTWGMFAIHAVAAITQLLSIFGIAAGINMMVWHYGVMLGGAITNMVAGVFYFMAYNNAANLLADNIEEVVGGYAAALMSYIRMDMIKMVASETGAMLTLMESLEMWMVAQWWALPEEERKAMYYEMHEGEKKGEGKKDKMFRKALSF